MKQLFVTLFLLGNCHANTFQNITSDAGISMAHSADKMSTGIAIADFDNNGFPDIFFTGYFNNSKLYLNQGDGTFSDNSNLFPNMSNAKCGSAAAADYDNDGWQDIYIACLGNNYLLRNISGTVFQNNITFSGTNHPERTEAVAWGDLNNDGWLDLVLGVHPLSFPPNLNDPNDLDHILINNGNGTFSPIFNNIVATDIAKATLALILTDIDFDNDLDIYIANDKLQENVMLRNDGLGCGGMCFTNIAPVNGSYLPANSMGIAVADFDNDSDWDMTYSSINEHLFLTNIGTVGMLEFEEQAIANGIGFVNGSGWGVLMFDADNDGWEDMYLATGQGTPSATNLFYQNDQDGTFTDVTGAVGLIDTNRTHAAVWLDFNKDGQLDLSYGRYNQTYELIENSGTLNNWVVFEFMGGLNVNRDAIGTKVELINNMGQKQIRELRAGESRGSNNQKILHFGLGSSENLDVTITWPDGTVQSEENIPINQYIKWVYPPYDHIFKDNFDF